MKLPREKVGNLYLKLRDIFPEEDKGRLKRYSRFANSPFLGYSIFKKNRLVDSALFVARNYKNLEIKTFEAFKDKVTIEWDRMIFSKVAVWMN